MPSSIVAGARAEGKEIHAAGRTDAGVHALAMSAHVEVTKTLTEHRLREGLNALVRPAPVSVTGVEPVADDWHARFSCIGRRYLYRILNHRAPPALDKGKVWHVPIPLDVDAMDTRQDLAELPGHDRAGLGIRVVELIEAASRSMRRKGETVYIRSEETVS